jgi:DNA polymerase-3 subunit delta'
MGGYKIGIIKHVDSLSTGAANALLKTLEEPRKDVVIIMIAEDADSLPATIASRSRILYFKPVESGIIYDYLIDEHKAGREEAKEMAQLCLGRPALAVKFLEDKEALGFYRKQVNVFLDFEQQSIGERFNAIAELFGKKPESREAVRIAKRILQAWQGALRDWLLLEHGYNNLIQHQIEAEKIKAMARRIKPAGIICLYQALKRAEANIEANVNPKLALEEVSLNF